MYSTISSPLLPMEIAIQCYMGSAIHTFKSCLWMFHLLIYVMLLMNYRFIFSPVPTSSVLWLTTRIGRHTKPPGFTTMGGALESVGRYNIPPICSIFPLQQTCSVCWWVLWCWWTGCVWRRADDAQWGRCRAHTFQGAFRGSPDDLSFHISCLQLFATADWRGLNTNIQPAHCHTQHLLAAYRGLWLALSTTLQSR